MSADRDLEVGITARRDASFLKRAEAAHEFSNGKLAILAAVFFAAVSGVVTLLVLR